MQLRLIRRLSSFEEPLDELVKIEFWDKDADAPDLHPSTYRVAEADDEVHVGEVTRVLAEHAASFLNPPRRIEAVRVDDCWAAVPNEQTKGRTQFRFANERHHEYRFADRSQLAALVAGLPGSPSVRERAELLAYVRGRLAANDAEWVSGLRNLPNGPKWLALLER